MVAVDVVFRAGFGVESRVLRQRPNAGRWTHVGLLFRDGHVFHCDARRGACVELWQNFSLGQSQDIGRVSLRCSRPGEARLQATCQEMVGRGLGFADDYCDWQKNAQSYYCTTFICEALAKAWGFVALGPETIPRQTIPLLGERRLLLPQQLYAAITARLVSHSEIFG